jgi:hypothetical protein
VIEGLSSIGVPLSIDTYKPEVMRAAIIAGVDIVNDVCALQEPNALEIVAASNVGVCLMHMQGRPQTMQQDPQYQDVVEDVCDFLKLRLAAAEHAGIAKAKITLDPGFGFGKRTAHNLALLDGLSTLKKLGAPLLIGLSRKSVLRLPYSYRTQVHHANSLVFFQKLTSFSAGSPSACPIPGFRSALSRRVMPSSASAISMGSAHWIFSPATSAWCNSSGEISSFTPASSIRLIRRQAVFADMAVRDDISSKDTEASV